MENNMEALINPDNLYREIWSYCSEANELLKGEAQATNNGEPIDTEHYKALRDSIEVIAENPLEYVKTLPTQIDSLIIAMSRMITENNKRLLGLSNI